MEINKVIVSGYLTRNPEVKTFEHESKKLTAAPLKYAESFSQRVLRPS